jgi:hypothetical protein
MTFGKDYLCKGSILRKLGVEIDQGIEELERDIVSLKEAFPGRFTNDIPTGELLGKLAETSRRLRDMPDGDPKASGELAVELESRVDSVASAVERLRDMVGGKPPAYSRTEALSRIADRRRGVRERLGDLSGPLLKLFLALCLLSVIPLAYLTLTMDDESGLTDRITRGEARIEWDEARVSELGAELQEIRRTAAAIRNKNSREGKMERLQLQARAQQIENEIQRIEADAAELRKAVLVDKTKSREIGNKGFLDRLLRR